MGIREITFRGKRKSDGQWVEGDLSRCVVVGETHICRVEDNLSTTAHRVAPETVCQYTGLDDKNGRKIFEGDILSFSAYGENYKGDIRLIKGNFTIWCGKCAPFLDDALEKHSAIVIGNIFDNPELPEGGGTK